MISLIILAYNDGKSLHENIPMWTEVLEQISPFYEIIIADDCSADDTAGIVADFARMNKRIKYVRSEKNHGVGANFKMGLEHAKNNLIAYTDGDGQYLPADLMHLWKLVEQNDMVTGRRITRADTYLRSITSLVYNNLVKLIYQVPVRDINSGLKIFTRRYIECCSPQISNGPFYDAEYLIKGHRNGMTIKEIPIGHQCRKYGQASGISINSIRFLFNEVCKESMRSYTRSNYFSRFIFKVLAS